MSALTPRDRTWLKLLRIALGYGSRTERIQRMTHSVDADVSMLATSLKFQGYLSPAEGTVRLNPELDKN